MRKMWIDDLRPAPEGWVWVTSSDEALHVLAYRDRDGNPVHWDAISFDHDLGGEDTTRPVLLYLAEHDLWPDKCYVHSANPVGRQYIEGMITHYGPGLSFH